MKNLRKLSEILGLGGMECHGIPAWKWVEEGPIQGLVAGGRDPFLQASSTRWANLCPPVAEVASEAESRGLRLL